MLDKDYLIKGDMYQYNLGWLINTILSFKSDLETAIDLKTIKYADPIEWDITTQYAANTVVVDPKSGTAYMSKTAVPSGILLDNTTYWVVVFNYQEIYNKIMDGVAFNDRKNDYASRDLIVNDLVWYAGELYRVTKDIPNGAKYIVDTNISKISIESLLKNYLGNDRTASVSSDKLTASGDITEEAANKSVTVSGDLTIKAGDLTEDVENKTVTASGDITEEEANKSVTVSGDLTIKAGDLTEDVENKTVTASGDITEEAANKSVTVSGDLTIKAGDLTEDVENKTVTASGDITEDTEKISITHAEITMTNKNRQNNAKITIPDSLNGSMINIGQDVDFQKFNCSMQYSAANLCGTWTSGTLGLCQHSNDASCVQAVFCKTRSTDTADTPKKLQAGDDLGELRFVGSTDTTFKDGGWITAKIPKSATIDDNNLLTPTQFGFAPASGSDAPATCVMRHDDTAFTKRVGFGMASTDGGGDIEVVPDGAISAYFNTPICIAKPGELLYNARYLNGGYKAIKAGSCFNLLQSGDDLLIIGDSADAPDDTVSFTADNAIIALPNNGNVRLPRIDESEGEYIVTMESDSTLRKKKNSNISSKSVVFGSGATANTWTTIGSFSLPSKGNYLLIGNVHFTENVNGNLKIDDTKVYTNFAKASGNTENGNFECVTLYKADNATNVPLEIWPDTNTHSLQAFV